jgi:hypothetical protein
MGNSLLTVYAPLDRHPDVCAVVIKKYIVPSINNRLNCSPELSIIYVLNAKEMEKALPIVDTGTSWKFRRLAGCRAVKRMEAKLLMKKYLLIPPLIVLLCAFILSGCTAPAGPKTPAEPTTPTAPATPAEPTKITGTETLPSDDTAPDLIITNGKIITVDEAFSTAEAVAVKDGKILAVGTSREIEALIGDDTRVLDLKGAALLPGINDSHIHLGSFGLSRPPLVLDVAFPTVKSIADIAATVGDRVAGASPGEWIQGQGWDEGFLTECVADPSRNPTRYDLDAVSPDNPVALTDFSGHVCWANSKALVLARITRDTADPPGGTIVKDPVTGEPTGILLENAAWLIRMLMPPPSADMQREGLLTAIAEVASLGITSVTEPGLSLDAVYRYNDLYKEGLLTVRVNCMIMAGSSLEQTKMFLGSLAADTDFGNDWVRISGVKMFADGIPPSRTACMWDEYLPYPDGRSGGSGSLLIAGSTDEQRYNTLIEMIKYASAKGFQVGIHATGDRTIDACVDGYIAALQEHPWDARHYIIHSDFVTPECAGRMAAHGIQASVQSSIKWTIGNLMEGIVGPEKAAYQWPLRMMLEKGIIVANGSDSPVTYPDWRQGVESAVIREDKATGKVSGPEQCITVEEAIRTYTISGAWQDHQEDVKGSIETGKWADFTVIGEDILAVDPHDISEIPVWMTIAGGKVVYTNPDSPLLVE